MALRGRDRRGIRFLDGGEHSLNVGLAAKEPLHLGPQVPHDHRQVGPERRPPTVTGLDAGLEPVLVEFNREETLAEGVAGVPRRGVELEAGLLDGGRKRARQRAEGFLDQGGELSTDGLHSSGRVRAALAEQGERLPAGTEQAQGL